MELAWHDQFFRSERRSKSGMSREVKPVRWSEHTFFNSGALRRQGRETTKRMVFNGGLRKNKSEWGEWVDSERMGEVERNERWKIGNTESVNQFAKVRKAPFPFVARILSMLLWLRFYFLLRFLDSFFSIQKFHWRLVVASRPSSSSILSGSIIHTNMDCYFDRCLSLVSASFHFWVWRAIFCTPLLIWASDLILMIILFFFFLFLLRFLVLDRLSWFFFGRSHFFLSFFFFALQMFRSIRNSGSFRSLFRSKTLSPLQTLMFGSFLSHNKLDSFLTQISPFVLFLLFQRQCGDLLLSRSLLIWSTVTQQNTRHGMANLVYVSCSSLSSSFSLFLSVSVCFRSFLPSVLGSKTSYLGLRNPEPWWACNSVAHTLLLFLSFPFQFIFLALLQHLLIHAVFSCFFSLFSGQPCRCRSFWSFGQKLCLPRGRFRRIFIRLCCSCDGYEDCSLDGRLCRCHGHG